MITPAHAQLMARYNRWQNGSLYGAADRLTDAERKEQRGAFFGSIHGTLSHLLFGDQIWLYRFTGDATLKPSISTIAESLAAVPDWGDLKAARFRLDAAISGWAGGLKPQDLLGDLSWYSGAMRCDLTRPRWELVVHMFNHQTHHRGQVHCLLTQFGQKPADTDIPFMPNLHEVRNGAGA
jgi:uncharacterized damage-inducible protein DinB